MFSSGGCFSHDKNSILHRDVYFRSLIKAMAYERNAVITPHRHQMHTLEMLEPGLPVEQSVYLRLFLSI